MNRQSRFDAWYRVLGAGALGWPRGMGWGGRCKGGSGWGTHVHSWWIQVNVWQNQYNIVKWNKLINLKKDLNDPCNIDSVITHLEPDILECEVKWALESIITKKASGSDGISAELLKITLLKCCAQYASKVGKLSNGHRNVNGQFSLQFQRMAMPKNV